MQSRVLPLLLGLGLTLTCTPARPGAARVAAATADEGACPGRALAFSAGQEEDAALAVFTRWAERWRRARATPGLSIAIVRGGEIIYAHDFGLADAEARRPAGPRTRYRVASLTKLMTAAAALRLWEAGKLGLDQPVQGLVPELAVVPGREPPTARDLLRHTSGLPRDFAPAYFTDAAIPSRAQTRVQIATLQQGLPAGATGKYSNAAYVVLGEAVAAAAGGGWEDYIEREVLAPRGMADTRLTPRADDPDLAVGYDETIDSHSPAARRIAFRAAGILTAAGGAASTAKDMARLAAIWLGHAPEMIGERTRAEACAPQWHDADEDVDHCLPLFAVERDGLRHLRHTGSLDGFTSAIDLVPALDLGVVVLTNAADGAPLSYTRQAISMLHGARELARRPVSAAPAVPACPYLGDFGFGGVRQVVLQLGSQLYMLAPGDDDAWTRPTRLTPAGADAFLMEGGLWTGEVLRFRGAPGAAAAEMAVNGIRWPRLPPPPLSGDGSAHAPVP